MRTHFTDISIRALKSCERQYKVWDTTTPGFGVLVGKRKSWIVMQGAKRRLKVIGRFPDVPLVDARKAAKKLLSNGLPEVSLSFKQAVELFIEDKRKNRRRRTVDEYERLLRNLSISSLDITPHHTARALAEFTARGTYNHTLIALRIFFNWCIKRQYVDRNPTLGLSQHKSQSRSRVLSDDELKAIWGACSDDSNDLPRHFRTIVKLLVLTGQRRGEIAGLRPSYIDLDQWTICLPEHLVKNSRQHRFPIGTLAVELLSKAAAPMSASELIFPSRHNGNAAFSGWSKSKSILDTLSRVSDWTLHDLRRTYRTVHARIGTPPHIAERLINHVSGVASQVELIYDRHSYLPEMRKAVDAYESALSRILAPEQSTARAA